MELASVSVKIDAAAFNAALPGAQAKWLQDVATAVDKVGDKVVETAKGLVAKRTGKLASTIVRGPLTIAGSRIFVQITAGDGTRYAIYQEFGTHKMAAHPYMRPAFGIAASSLRGAGIAARVTSTASSRAAVHRAVRRQQLRLAVRTGTMTFGQARRESARISRIRNFGAKGAKR
jgi:HK97 gp10 family phage protein